MDQITSWDKHWSRLKLKGPLFGVMASFVRRFIFQPAVRFYAQKYFSSQGVFVEMGCGVAESSATISSRGRLLVGLDFSLVALDAARKAGTMGGLLCGDLLLLPILSRSIDGLWNLGVMEHFSEQNLSILLDDFNRVLKKGGTVILFWPTALNLSRWVLAPIEWAKGLLSGSKYRFFPDEISLLNSKTQVRNMLRASGLTPLSVDFSWRTAFIHMVVVGRKLDL